MNSGTTREVFSNRIINVSLAVLYEAFANPLYLKKWWGPNGFSNTFHEFDLRPNGKWSLTMHGPEKGNYENAVVFTNVEAYKLISWSRLTPPFFDMEVGFKEIDEHHSEIYFRMIFQTEEEHAKMVTFVAPKNEENFDRLERELKKNEGDY